MGVKILILDDDPILNETLIDLLSQGGHDVRFANHIPVANELLESFNPDVVLLDLWMPGMNGLTYLQQEIRAIRPDVNVLLMTGMPVEVMEKQARAEGVTVILKKPLDLDMFGGSARRAWRRRVLEAARRHGPGRWPTCAPWGFLGNRFRPWPCFLAPCVP
ncbi:MAG: response regulator [Proteobacteria bacterium]|nr:response regulator [Pseudomonadota bacterium]